MKAGSTGSTPLRRWRGRQVAVLSDDELERLRRQPIGATGTARRTEAHKGRYIWLCYGIDPAARRIAWVCAAVVISCCEDVGSQGATVMLIGQPFWDASI